jgi:hypothetical protein
MRAKDGISVHDRKITDFYLFILYLLFTFAPVLR